MNNFFTHPMRPFFVGAAILAIVGALSFFISPDDLILHRKIFLEFMLPAAYGGFLTASMLEWTNYKGNLKPIATILAVLLLAGLVLLPFSPQTCQQRFGLRRHVSGSNRAVLVPTYNQPEKDKEALDTIQEAFPNPIQELKQGEEITFTGNGGRSKQSMVKRTRQHHKD